MKHADPSRRIPTYLQPYTVENAIWQIKIAVVLVAGMAVVDYVKDRREFKKYKNL